MTLAEFNRYNENKNMPYDYIGQGNGYKVMDRKWDDIDNDEIIYIPEYGYEGNYVERANAYSKRDFKNAVKDMYPKLKGKRLDDLACSLFECVDWQFPETVLLEDWFLTDEEREMLE